MLVYVNDIREHKSKGGKRHILFETVLIKQISTSCHFVLNLDHLMSLISNLTPFLLHFFL